MLTKKYLSFWITLFKRFQASQYNFIKIKKIDKALFRSELNQGQSWNTVRYHWKYSVGTHAVFGTPTFNLNSVRVDGAETFTTDQWIALLKKFQKSTITKNLSANVDNFY